MDTRKDGRIDDRHRRTRQLGTVLPPLDALWSFRRRENTDLNVVKAARASIIWRGADAWDFVRIASRYLRWTRFPNLLIRAMLANSGNSRRRFGRSLLGQSADIIGIAVANGLTPDQYYRAALARYRGGPEIYNYLPFDLLRAVALNTSEYGGGFWSERIKNKHAFESRCRKHGLPVVRTVALANETEILTPTGNALAGPLPNRDLIIKPITGEQGTGIEMWQSDGSDRFVNAENGILSSADLAVRASSLARTHGCTMLLQERLENHPDIQQIAGAALSTMRIGTMFNEHGEPEIVDAAYRTSTAPHAAVNNFHAGGLGFPIDVNSGLLSPGVVNGPYDPSSPITHHPQTGARVAGLRHPAWHTASELALRLHRLFPDLVMPGWDIGFDKNGPIAIEGNHVSGISLTRQPSFGGLVGTRTLTLLAYHANQWIERNEPERSRWRFSRNGTHPRRSES